MIYTCTLNPSIDFIVHVDNFQVGHLNRSISELKYPGGKGINVSRVLNRIGLTNRALGFLGGFTGDYIEKCLQKEGVEADFVKVENDTRINIKLKTEEETEINGQGPSISEEKLALLFAKLDQLTNEDFLVLAGSIPSSLPPSLYKDILSICSKQNVKVAVDTAGKILLELLAFRPFLIKPNHHELGELFDVEITTAEQAIPYGKKLVELGAENVIVSMAGAGALFINKEMILFANVPKGKVKNSVGAGDSVVAGFVGTYSITQDVKAAFQFGVASGSATAFSEDLCTRNEIEKLVPEVNISPM